MGEADQARREVGELDEVRVGEAFEAPGAAAGQAGQPGAQPEAAGGALNGTFSITLTLSDQSFAGTLVLRQEGNSISGSMQTQVGTSEFSNGTVNGDTFRISATASIQGQAIPITIEGTVRGDSISGTLQSSYGNATFTGSRQP